MLPLVSGTELALAHETGGGGGGVDGGGVDGGVGVEAFAVADMDAILRQLRLWASVAVVPGLAAILLAEILLDFPGRVGSGTGIDIGGGIGVVTGIGGRRVVNLSTGAALAAVTAAAAASTEELRQLSECASALLPAP